MSKNDLKKLLADYYAGKSLPQPNVDRLVSLGEHSGGTQGIGGLPRDVRRTRRAVIGWAAMLIVIPSVAVVAYQRGYAHGRKTQDGPSTPAPRLAMPQYLLALYQSPDAVSPTQEVDKGDQVEQYRKWAGRVASEGLLVGGEKLTNDVGRFLTVRDGQPVVLSGADPHDGQALAGFFVVRANSYDQAIDIARTCPHAKYGSGIAIRQIDRLDAPDTAYRDRQAQDATEGES